MIELDGAPLPIDVQLPAAFASYYTLSPYVIFDRDVFRVLLRLVNRSDNPNEKVSRIHAGVSSAGVSFEIEDKPVLAPDTMMEDSGGCEDPTIVPGSSSVCVFYSGYSIETRASSMLVARGLTLNKLEKCGVAFSDFDYENPKEAVLVATGSGYRMFFEYAADGRSKIGVADAAELAGPWHFSPTPIVSRDGKFDAYHLSPVSCVRLTNGCVVLFYNGSTQELAWRVGWALLDPEANAVVARGDGPIITPGMIANDDTDIAFGASTVVSDAHHLWMYYTVSDRTLMRARLHIADAVTDDRRQPLQA